ncbi:MAG: hypothetical protein ACOZB3_08130 [Calditrichota bacterium]
MSPADLDIPPLYRELFDAAGPVVRYRLVRDVLGRDDSFIQTAHLGLELPRLTEVEALLTAQEMDGSWSGLLGADVFGEKIATETALLRLCELGLENHEAVQVCIEKALIPTLFHSDVIWEWEKTATDDLSRRAARQIVRDKALRLIVRATSEMDEVLKPVFETIITEWNHYLEGGNGGRLAPPTTDAYAALCWYRWSDDDFPRVRGLVKRLVERAESVMGHPISVPEIFSPHLFQLADKWEYLARPPLFFLELELAARLGVARDLPVTQWMLDELEMRQDADGRFRFSGDDSIEQNWYYPLDRTGSSDPSVEWTFRAALIYKLLEYDL